MATFAQLRDLALSQVGTVESPPGSNRTKYNAFYGMQAQPWCAMFTSWLMAELGLIGQCNFSTSKGYAYTPTGVAGFKQRGKWGTTPRLGAHVFFRFSGPRVHHVGIVIGINADGSIDTVEGNTSPGAAGSQRDGGGVYRRRRKAGIVGYGYIDYEAGGPAPDQEEDDMPVAFGASGSIEPGGEVAVDLEPLDGWGQFAEGALVVNSLEPDNRVWVVVSGPGQPSDQGGWFTLPERGRHGIHFRKGDSFAHIYREGGSRPLAFEVVYRR